MRLLDSVGTDAAIGTATSIADEDDMTATDISAAATAAADDKVILLETIDPKEAVKVFGRLAEKYIALDSSGGMCCYSACTNCEFRLPGGGYIMADQSAARPKWIPNYERRNSNNREHVTKWSTSIFPTPDTLSVSRDDFVARVRQMDYAPPLGGPYVGASAATIETSNTAAIGRLFDALADGKTKLTRHRMSLRLKQLADGEEGMTWQSFERVMGLV
jgi:hypothetical protein